jgi:hypothetical protein
VAAGGRTLGDEADCEDEEIEDGGDDDEDEDDDDDKGEGENGDDEVDNDGGGSGGHDDDDRDDDVVVSVLAVAGVSGQSPVGVKRKSSRPHSSRSLSDKCGSSAAAEQFRTHAVDISMVCRERNERPLPSLPCEDAVRATKPSMLSAKIGSVSLLEQLASALWMNADTLVQCKAA